MIRNNERDFNGTFQTLAKAPGSFSQSEMPYFLCPDNLNVPSLVNEMKLLCMTFNEFFFHVPSYKSYILC